MIVVSASCPHRVELGRVHAKLGNKQEALRQLELALTLEVEDINAYLQKQDVYPILKGLKRRRWGLPSAPDAAPDAASEPASGAASQPPASGDGREAAGAASPSWQPRPTHAQSFPSMSEHANPYSASMAKGGHEYKLQEALSPEGWPAWLTHGQKVLGGWREWGGSSPGSGLRIVEQPSEENAAKND